MRKEYVTLLLVFILAFSLIPQKANASLTSFSITTNFPYGLTTPYDSVFINNYLVLGYLTSATQLTIFTYSNQTAVNTTINIQTNNPIVAYYLFPFNNTNVLIILFNQTMNYDYCAAYWGGHIGWYWESVGSLCPNSNNTFNMLLTVTAILFNPSSSSILSRNQWSANYQFNIYVTSQANNYLGMAEVQYVGSNSYALSNINPRVFIIMYPDSSYKTVAFALAIVNYNYFAIANIGGQQYISDPQATEFYAIIDTYSLLNQKTASGWIDFNGEGISFTATYTISTNALSINSVTTLSSQPFPYITQYSITQNTTLYSELGYVNYTSNGNLYLFIPYNTPQYVPNNGYLYPTLFSQQSVQFYYMLTSGSTKYSYSESVSSGLPLQDVGGVFYYPSVFRVIDEITFIDTSVGNSYVNLDAWNNNTVAQLQAMNQLTISGKYVVATLQYFSNCLIYWSSNTNTIYIQLISGTLNNVQSGNINAPPPSTTPPTPPPPGQITNNYTLSFTPSTINMIIASIFIFIPAIILIPFLGLAGFIAGATLGTIFAVIAGFIPYWALAVIVLLIIALILRGKSFSKED